MKTYPSFADRRAGASRLFAALPIILGCCLLSTTALASEQKPPTQGALSAVVPAEGGEARTVELPLKHTEVEAEISGHVTRVKVTQTFTNPHDQPIEAVYVFPLPQNAAVNDMQIRVGDRVIRGLIKKREEAKHIYEKARQDGKTAALLEQERPNIFSQSIANILPGHDIVVEIAYDDLLPYEQGRYEFVFPMVVGPRYIPGRPTGRKGGGWADDTDQVPDASRITPPVLKPGERNGHDIMVTVKLDAGLPVQALECPTHEVVLTPDTGPFDGPVTVRMAPRDTVPNKDFVLRYTVAGDAPRAGFLARRDEDGGTFMLMFQPPIEARPEAVTPKEMVFVLDCSGSMSGEPLALVKKAVRHALNNLNPGDTFQVIRFSDRSSALAPEPIEATPENVRRGLSYLNGLNSEGGTEMLEGIKAALDFPHRGNRLRIVCFMTDGYIGNEKQILDAVRARLGDDTRLFAFGVGSSVNRYLLERMAEVGRGEVKYVLLSEKPEDTVAKFYERIHHPVLTHLRVDWAGLEVEELYPARLPDLFAGQPLVVLGRYRRPGADTIRVQGQVNGRPVVYELSVSLPDAESGHAGLTALWARRRIAALSMELYGGRDPDAEAAITELALRHNLVSEFTSFVAVEETVVNEGGELMTIQVPVEMPEGVSHEGVFGPDADAYRGRQTGGAPLMLSGLFAGRSAGGRMVRSTAPMSVSSELAEPLPEAAPAAGPMKAFALVFKLPADRGEEVLRLTRAGELWLERGGERVLLGRLTHQQRRELWALLLKALKDIPERVPWTKVAELTVQFPDDAAGAERRILAGPEAGEPTGEWKNLLDYLDALRAGF